MSEIRLHAEVLIKAGLEADLVILENRELATTTDTFKLFVGDSDNVPHQIGGGASALADLQDVLLTSPGARQALLYNGTKWINDDLVISDISGLQTALDNEATTRAAAITAEASARSAADTVLQGNIDAEATSRASGDSTNATAITAEASTRASADTILAGDISDEADARASADATLAAAISGKQAALGFTPEDVANKATSTSLGTSDTLYPSQNAVKAYIDAQITAHMQALAKGGTGVDLSASGGLTKFLAQDASHVISARDLTRSDIAKTMLAGYYALLPSAKIVSCFSQLVSATTVDLWTVSSGKRATIQCSLTNRSGGSINSTLQIKKSGQGSYTQIAIAGANGNNAKTLQGNWWNTYPILDAGDIFSLLLSSAGSSNIRLTGFVCEFDATEPLIASPFVLALASGDNLIYTVPSNTRTLFGNYGANANFPFRVINTSGATRTYTVYAVPSGGSTSDNTTIWSAATFTVANNTASSQAFDILGLDDGGKVYINSDSGAAGQNCYLLNVWEFPYAA